jgi:aldehyde:ferredoxin oxidoreductase
MLIGCTGKLLRVDLKEGSSRVETLTEESARRFFGGRGLGARILFQELQPGIDPFSPENKIVFATGPITGAPFSGNSRYVVMAKSPLTNAWGEANASGWFGPELKFAGYDAIVVEGKAFQPVYILVGDETVDIRDASKLWGKTTGETQNAIRDENKDENIRVAGIGPGGENLVRFASVISDLNRAAGRCGIGAVMGSKKLKAIAVRGHGEVSIADKASFREFAQRAAKEALSRGWGKGLREHGTDGGLEVLSATGRLPTQAFKRGTFEGADKITGATMSETILKNIATCPNCVVACKRVVEAKEPYEVDPAYDGPEYETCASLGSLCMNDNLVAISKGNELCDKYSLDTISTGVTIAFAMECYEKGLLTKADTGGLDLAWGNHRAMIQLIEMIANREGIGDLLAEGVVRASKKIGRGAEQFALCIKGQELPMHEPRGKKGVALAYAVSNRGACHLQAPHDDSFESEMDLDPAIGFSPSIAPRHRLYTGKEKVQLVRIGQDLYSLNNCLVTCGNQTVPWNHTSETMLGLIRSITGWDVTWEELLTVGERATNLCRAFNAREGLRREDDTIPRRLMEPLPDGLYKGEAVTEQQLNQMLDYYYEMMGWDPKTGIPREETLRSLGLDFAVDQLSRLQCDRA